MRIGYRAERVFDGLSDEIMRDGVVVVEEGRIVEIASAKATPAVSELMDLGDATIMPGLIDAHVHLVWSACGMPHEVVEQEGVHLTVLRASRNAFRHIKAGVTTIRDVGSTAGIALDIARAVDRGIIPGPRIFASGRAMAMTGGHAHCLGREVDGADAMRYAVRSEIRDGARCIKLMASGGVYGHAEEIGSPQLSVSEMAAATEEAHNAGRHVTAHAYTPPAIVNALDAGVDCIEHGSFITPEIAERMRAQGKYLVPTISVYQAMHDGAEEEIHCVPPELRRKTLQVLEASRAAFRLAMDVGVPIATGTDCGSPNHPHGSIAREIALMVEYGASPSQALRFATSSAAKLLRLDDEIGTLAPGKRADLIAVAEDPLRNVAALDKIKLVIRDGRQFFPVWEQEASA